MQKQNLEKVILNAYGAYYNLPAALQNETALGPDETRYNKRNLP